MKVLLSHVPGLRGLLTALAALICSRSVAHADVRLPHIFADHLVLQKSARTAIWGWAAPDEEVTVTLDKASAKARAGADGKWRVFLNLDACGPGPFSLNIAGKNTLTLSDVLVGQVWMAAGQSNMEFRLRQAFGAADEVAHSDNPLLRQYFVHHNEKAVPMDDVPGEWTVAGPQTAGEFSAVGYFFAKELQQTLHVPVAIIHDSFGGTASEPWTSSEGLDANPELKAAKDASIQHWATLVEQSKQFTVAISQWLETNQRQDKKTAKAADFAVPDLPVSDWISVSLPGEVSGKGLPPAGAFWLRKEITLSAAAAHPADGRISIEFDASVYDFESIYWNGERTVEVLPKDRNQPFNYVHRNYGIPAKLLQEGRNVIAIRLFSPVRSPKLWSEGKPRGLLNLQIPPLSGDWLVKAEYGFPPAAPAAVAALPGEPYAAYRTANPKRDPVACQLFNGMVSPILPYSIAGTIWYQGESNVVRANQYRTAFPLLIKDWRSHWGQGDFPFYFCQIANVGGKSPVVSQDPRAELRESQSKALALPNTGQAVLIDIGEPDIHPRDKRDVGDRLARIALTKTYHHPMAFSGPTYLSKKGEGGAIRLAFADLEGGLVARPLAEVGKIYYDQDPKNVPPPPPRPGSSLQGFAVCGADQKWVLADASIEGDTVLVRCLEVSQPTEVRYAWAGNPICNLFNKAGLPASPFRTDHFPLSTADIRYGQ